MRAFILFSSPCLSRHIERAPTRVQQEFNDLVIPGIRCPVIHVFEGVPGLETGGIARVSCFGEMSFISSQNMGVEVDLELFFELCERLFMLPPQQ